MVSALDFQSDCWRVSGSRPVLFPQARNFAPHCLSSPRFIKGPGEHTAGGNSAMDKHPIQGE